MSAKRTLSTESGAMLAGLRQCIGSTRGANCWVAIVSCRAVELVRFESAMALKFVMYIPAMVDQPEPNWALDSLHF